MEADALIALIAAGEAFDVEFKRASPFGKLSDHDIVEAVVCLANGAGGTLLLGVEDDRTITGMAPRHTGRTDAGLLAAMILNRTEPNVAVAVDVVHVHGVDVGVIDVPDAKTPVGTKSGKYVRRSTKADGRPECVPYPLHEMLAAGLAAQGRDYAATPARGALLDDLDDVEFDRFRRMCATSRGDGALAESGDTEILRALRLTEPGGDTLTLGAILLFGSSASLERFVPTAEVVFQVIESGGIVHNETLRGPLLATAERLYSLIDQRNSEQELMVGLHRVGVRRIPPATIRESIANALVHRDYSEQGVVSVQLGADSMRIGSPGGFPPGITLDNLLDETKPRSLILAEAFKRAGVVDRAGRGVAEMFQSQLRAGRGGPDYSATNERSVAVTIPTADADLELVRFVLDHESASQASLSLPQLRILYELKTMGPQTLEELLAALRIPEPLVRTNLARLIESGLVEPRGPGRNRRHHLTAAFYRVAQSSEYVRLQDTDPIQQQQMVLSYVEKFGSITRSKAAELCRLSPTQARAVLKRLVEADELLLVGERRGAHYIRP